MGAWGTAISSNDTYADIYADFFERYNNGGEVSQITTSLIKANKDTLHEQADSNNFWFAIAKAQWECKSLDPSVYGRVKSIIESGSDLLLWKELDAYDKDLQKRKIALDKFLADISSERPKPKPRKKPVIRQAVFAKGDCITFKLDNGNYGGAVVLETINHLKYAYNLVATTNINQTTKPVGKDFIAATVLIKTFASWKEKPAINWISPLGYESVKHLFEITDRMSVDLSYEMKDTQYMAGAGFDRIIIESAKNQFNTSNPQSPKITTMRNLIRNEIPQQPDNGIISRLRSLFKSKRKS